MCFIIVGATVSIHAMAFTIHTARFIVDARLPINDGLPTINTMLVIFVSTRVSIHTRLFSSMASAFFSTARLSMNGRLLINSPMSSINVGDEVQRQRQADRYQHKAMHHLCELVNLRMVVDHHRNGVPHRDVVAADHP